MTLVDANLLLYARIPSFPQHDAARRWLDEQLNGPAAVGMPWPSLLAYIRISSNPRAMERPQPVGEAWRQVEEWLDQRRVWIPSPGEGHRKIVGKFLENQALRGNLVPDAHLAALAVEHGLVLCSTDGDFARFPGLRWENPLQRDGA